MNHEIEPVVDELAVQTPAWFPEWATQLADLYFSGTTCLFVLHGNVHDLICCADQDDSERFVTLEEFCTYSDQHGNVRRVTPRHEATSIGVAQ